MNFAGEKFNLTPRELLKVITGHAGNYLDNLTSGDYNIHNQGQIASPSDIKNMLFDTQWNYSNMGKTIEAEKARELEKINQILGLPITRGNFSGE